MKSAFRLSDVVSLMEGRWEDLKLNPFRIKKVEVVNKL